MRCIEIKNIKGLHNGYSGLTLTWDVLKLSWPNGNKQIAAD